MLTFFSDKQLTTGDESSKDASVVVRTRGGGLNPSVGGLAASIGP